MFSIGVYCAGIFNLCALLFGNSSIGIRNFYNSWEISSNIDIHKIYYGMYLNLGYISIIDFLSRNKINYNVILSLLLAALTIFLIVYVGAMSGVFIFLSLNLLLLTGLISKKLRFGYTLTLIGMPFLIMFFLAFPKAQSIFSHLDGESSRMRNYEVNKNLFFEAPIFGYGIGNERAVMQSGRDNKSWEYKNNYHAHNQYFELLIGGGLTLLMITLFLPGLLVWKSITFNFNLPAVSYVIILFAIFLIESVLRRHHGIIFFSFFLPLFLFMIKSNQKINTRINKHED
ncbi:O-antigen ligase family protein [Maribacter sp. 2210JD10-5]|uniref:O-antigen ligase family protein n=1 Tax=Maribacter sp. 2210JD10-5 TaxID=3386272 RepID=UPI0039BC2CEE